MVPVRSEPTQPVLPSVLPIRLLPVGGKGSEGIGPAGDGRVLRHDGVADGHRATRVVKAAAVAGGVAADGAVGQRGRAAVVVTGRRHLAGGVAADGAVGQRGRTRTTVAVVAEAAGGHSAAVASGGVAADGAVGQRGRGRPPKAGGVAVAQAAAIASGGVAADGAVGQRGRAAVVVHAAAAVIASGGVAADGAVGQLRVALLYCVQAVVHSAALSWRSCR